MSTRISRLVILAIVISALIVSVSAISAIAFQQGDTSSSYKSGNTAGSNRIGTPDRSEGVTAPGAGTEDPTQQCQVSCSTEKSGIERALCSLGCGYLSRPAPVMP
jgi:hypothetical protein